MHQNLVTSPALRLPVPIVLDGLFYNDKKEAAATVKELFKHLQGFHHTLSDLDKFVNYSVDNNGDTALHIALTKQHQQVVEELLTHHADLALIAVSRKWDSWNIMNDKLHKVFLRTLDKGLVLIKDEDDLTDETQWNLKCDFTFITGIRSVYKPKKYNLRETRLLAMKFAHSSNKQLSEVLFHPLVIIFLYLKGQRFNKLIFVSILYNIAWFVLCAVYLVDITQKTEAMTWVDSSPLADVSLAVYILFPLFLFKEITELRHYPGSKFTWWHIDNIGQWTVLFSVFYGKLMTSLNLFSTVSPVATIGILAALLQIQGQFTKFEFLGIYNYMFIQSFERTVKFFLAFSPMPLIFVFTFVILLPQVEKYNFDSGLAVVTTLAMMTGEINYDEIHSYDASVLPYPTTTKLAFLLFVILVVIILQNLLISVAVDGIQESKRTFKTNHLGARLKIIFLLERFFMPKLARLKLDRLIQYLMIVPQTYFGNFPIESSQNENPYTVSIKFVDLPAPIQKAITISNT